MRYIYVAIIAFSLLAFSGGVSISKHYCGGDLVSKSINVANSSCGEMNIPIQEPGYNKTYCCEDEIAFYQASDYEVLKRPIVNNLFVSTQNYFQKSLLSHSSNLNLYDDADPRPDRPVYLLVRHLLI